MFFFSPAGGMWHDAAAPGATAQRPGGGHFQRHLPRQAQMARRYRVRGSGSAAAAGISARAFTGGSLPVVRVRRSPLSVGQGPGIRRHAGGALARPRADAGDRRGIDAAGGFGDANVIEIPVTPAQAADAQAFVWQSLAANNGVVAPLRTGPYDDSLYYASSDRYSGLHTCNTWAAQGLQAAHLPVYSEGVEFAGQLWRQALRLSPSPGADPVRIDASPGRAPPPPSTQLHGG